MVCGRRCMLAGWARADGQRRESRVRGRQAQGEDGELRGAQAGDADSLASGERIEVDKRGSDGPGRRDGCLVGARRRCRLGRCAVCAEPARAGREREYRCWLGRERSTGVRGRGGWRGTHPLRHVCADAARPARRGAWEADGGVGGKRPGHAVEVLELGPDGLERLEERAAL